MEHKSHNAGGGVIAVYTTLQSIKNDESTVFTKSRRSSVNFTFVWHNGSILLVMLTSFSWALINMSALFMVKKSDID